MQDLDPKEAPNAEPGAVAVSYTHLDVYKRQVSGFMLQNAYEAARKVVAGQDIITLSDRDRDAFLSALENPPEPTQALILSLIHI